jgi:sugar phosphate isomerase/epimerase
MSFIIGLTIQQIGTILPSTFVKFASSIGLEHIEFDKTVFSDINNVIRSLKAKQTVIHSPYFEDYGLDLSTKSNKAEIFVNNVIRYRKSLNIKGVVVHPPSDASGSLDLFYDRLEKLPFPLLENMPYQTWDEYFEFFDDSKAHVSNKLGLCFDIPHSYITHGLDFLKLPSWCIDLLQSSNGYIHISGGSRSEDTHYPLLTEGDMPLKPIKQFLSKINFSGTITMELAPRKLEDVSKIIQSYIIMLGISGKRRHKLKVKVKRPFILRKVNKLSKEIKPEIFKRNRED